MFSSRFPCNKDVLLEVFDLVQSEPDRMNFIIAAGTWSPNEIRAFCILKDFFESNVYFGSDGQLALSMIDGSKPLVEESDYDKVEECLSSLGIAIRKFYFWSGARFSVLEKVIKFAKHLETLSCSAFLSNYVKSEAMYSSIFHGIAGLESIKVLDLSSNDLGHNLRYLTDALAQKSTALSNLVELDISANRLERMDGIDFSELFYAISKLPKLSKLGIGSNDLSEKSLPLLSPLIPSMKQLKELDISNTGLYKLGKSSDGDLSVLESFFESLATLALLKNLNIRKNMLGRKIFLLSPILSTRKLRHLDISENRIGDIEDIEPVEMFFEMICSCTNLNSLRVDMNRLGSMVSPLSVNLNMLTSLETLSLKANGLGSCEEKVISDLFAGISCLPSLKYLDLSMNDIFKLDGLVAAFPCLPKLEHFYFGHNDLGSVSDKEEFFAAFAKASRNLRVLDLERSRLPAVVGPAFMSFLRKSCPNLEILNFDCNNLGTMVESKALGFFFDAISRMSKLSELHLRCNLIMSEGLESFCSPLRKMKNLQKLYLGDQESWLLDAESSAESYSQSLVSMKKCPADSVLVNFVDSLNQLPLLKCVNASPLKVKRDPISNQIETLVYEQNNKL